MATNQAVRLTFLGDASSAVRASDQLEKAMLRNASASERLAQTLQRAGTQVSENQHKVAASAASMSKATRQTEQDIGRAARGALVGSGAFGHLGRSIAFASATFIGAAGLSEGLHVAIDELENAAKTAAQTRAALLSTGGAAGVTAGHVRELSKALLQKSGYDDEAIASAENLLLTFREVRNETGKGNDVFDQATKAILDMSRAMGQDLSSTTLQVGKALNSPITGMIALRRVGVQFTSSQTATIKKLTETNHIVEAQKIILQELQKEFGGSAEAYGHTLPGKIDIFRESLKNVSAELLGALEPAFQDALDGAQKWANELEHNKKKQEELRQKIQGVVEQVHAFVSLANDAAKAVGGWTSAIEILIGLKLASKMGEWLGGLASLIGSGATGLKGAKKESDSLYASLDKLAKIKFIQVAIALVIYKKLFGDIQNQTSAAGDLVPVYKGGKWVDPNTGEPVADQAYWNKQFKKSGGTGKPLEGQQSSGIVTSRGAPPTSYANRVRTQTNGLTALQSSLPGPKGSNAIDYGGHAAKSYHYSGEALDIGDGGNPGSLISDWNYLYPLRQNFAELIWDPPANIRAHAPGSGAGYFWGVPGKFTDHTDHIHVAFTGDPADVSKINAAMNSGKTKTGPTPRPPRADQTPPPPSSKSASGFDLPVPLAVAIAKAETTKGTGDDRSAYNQAITFIRGRIESGKVTGKKLVDAYQMLKQYQDALDGLTKDPKSKAATGIADAASKRGAAYDVNQLQRQLKGFLAKTANNFPELDQAFRGKFTGFIAELAKFEKELQTKTVKSSTIAGIRERMGEIVNVVGGALTRLNSATAQKLAKFQSLWDTASGNALDAFDAQTTAGIQKMTDDVTKALQTFDDETSASLQALQDDATAQLKAFDKETSAFKTPTQQLLEQMTSSHDQQQLQQALADAQDSLAKALAGTVENAVTQAGDELAAARKKLGELSLEHALDVAQSQVLGGKAEDMSASILSQVREALSGAEASGGGQTTKVDPEAVASAQRAVAEAEYNIKVDGLQKQADAEATAYADSRADQRDALEKKLSDAETAYSKEREALRTSIEQAGADQVTQYEKDRAELRGHLDEALKIWGAYFGNLGTDFATAWGKIQALFAGFGVTIPDMPAGGSTGNLPTPTNPSGGAGQQANSGLFGAGGYFLLNPRAMAAGGSGRVYKPTLFLAGEAGSEDYAFSGGGRGFGSGGAAGTGSPIVVQIHTRDEALADFIDVRVSGPASVDRITRAQGRLTGNRLRGGRY